MSIKIKLLQGNEACVHGAIHAGMKFFAGYPITPSTEIAEISSYMLPKIGGSFIQMEDEIASMAATIGGSLAGKKSMTATSGPGFSLKQEAIGYACMTQTPCVIVNVQRSGPSTGLPTSPSQGDLMQTRWGTHGDHQIIVLSPTTVSECFELAVKSFNFSEKYKTPVILLLDEGVGHMREKVNLSNLEKLEVIDRKDLKNGVHNIGDGNRNHITGLVYDDKGFPSNDTNVAYNLFKQIDDKITKNLDDILIYDEIETNDCEILIISFGFSARSSKDSIKYLREKGIKVGLLVVKTVWPFPEKKVRQLSEKVKYIFVPEMNMGQMKLEIERVVGSNISVIGINKFNGEVIKPEDINTCIEGVYSYAK